jgi:hypothetical protein
MATYIELRDMQGEPATAALRGKLVVAVAIKAHSVINEVPPVAAKVQWAKDALASPARQAEILFPYLIAENNALSVAQIQGAADSAVQAGVDAAVDKLFGV